MLGDSVLTTQSAGTEIWQFFVLSISTFQPAGVVAASTLEATTAIDVIISNAKNRKSFAFTISPLWA